MNHEEMYKEARAKAQAALQVESQEEAERLTAEAEALMKRADNIKAAQDVITRTEQPQPLPADLPTGDTIPEGPKVTVTAAEEDKLLEARPFKSTGEFLIAVAGGTDPRLLPLRSSDPMDEGGYNMVKAVGAEAVGSLTPSRAMKGTPTGLGETIPSEGGFLVGTDRAAGLLQRTYEIGQVLQRCAMDPISAGSNSMTYRAIDETSRVDGSRMGGVRGYWVSEATEKTASQPKFREMELKLRKVAALCYATDELLADAAALQSWLMRELPQELVFVIEDAIINGTGAGQPLGILNSAATVSVAKETGQAATTIVAENIIKMWARMWARSRANAVWLYNQDCEPQLFQMNLAVGTGGMLVFMPPGGLSQAPYASLMGRPAIPVEYCKTLGTVGDILLVDLSQYQMISKGGIESASSIHVRFIYDETAFRFVYRVDGQPAWDSALTPHEGTNTLSPYISLATRS